MPPADVWHSCHTSGRLRRATLAGSANVAVSIGSPASIEPKCHGVLRLPKTSNIGSPRDPIVQSSNKPVTPFIQRLPRRQMLFMGTAMAGLLVVPPAFAQSVDARHWRGLYRRYPAARARRRQHRLPNGAACGAASALPRPTCSRPAGMNAVGIFLGRRGSEGYAVSVLSTARRRDRIVVVFEERMPAEMMMAQRGAGPAARRGRGCRERRPLWPAAGRIRLRCAGRHGLAGPSAAARGPSRRPADLALGDHPHQPGRSAGLRRAAPLPLRRCGPLSGSAAGTALGLGDLLVVHREVEAGAAGAAGRRTCAAAPARASGWA